MCSTETRGTQVSCVEPRDKSRYRKAFKEDMASDVKDGDSVSHQKLKPQLMIKVGDGEMIMNSPGD